ncbi:HNH endonuclease signature motif containing protein [uncultured Methanolobus sp.]|uniref:HNH endonuclease signature motif containing protein n=1 Tax=uncultured Methanolobus sp. TaxID=218300 RepID=UPI002AAA8CC3|nr:HNH endonuclease signature motif containing protein [uncultured Methanolobus sp.]
MDKQTYEDFKKRQRRGKIPPTACIVCGEDNPDVIEMHHVDGRNNSDWIEPLCKNCHFKVTSKQNRIKPKARSKNTSLQNLRAFNIISIGALAVELGNRLMKVGYEMVENV